MAEISPRSLYGGVDLATSDTTINLSERCESCEGKGKLVNVENEKFSPCPNPNCQRGYVLTYAGQEMLRFVREWADHPAIDAEEPG